MEKFVTKGNENKTYNK